MVQRLQEIVGKLYKPPADGARQVFALSRGDAERLPRLPSIAIISVTARERPPASLDGFAHLLRLSFADIDFLSQSLSKKSRGKLGNAFTAEHARTVRSFVEALPVEVESVVVHCEGGYSRSCAIALALHRLYGYRTEMEHLTQANPSIVRILANAEERAVGQVVESTRTRRPSKASPRHTNLDLDPGTFEAEAQSAREALIASAQVLPAEVMWTTLGVTRQALNKAVVSGRIFTVDIGSRQYYPAFYLSPEIDRKLLARVTQALGALPGWSKWQFFTTGKGSLNGDTPLEAIKNGHRQPVMAAAAAFASRQGVAS